MVFTIAQTPAFVSASMAADYAIGCAQTYGEYRMEWQTQQPKVFRVSRPMRRSMCMRGRDKC